MDSLPFAMRTGIAQIDQQHQDLRQQIAEWLRLARAGSPLPSLARHVVDERQLLALSLLPTPHRHLLACRRRGPIMRRG